MEMIPDCFAKAKPSPFVNGSVCVMLSKWEEMTFRGESFVIKKYFWHDISTGHEFTDNECPDFMWDLFKAYCDRHYDSFTEIWPEMKKDKNDETES